MPLHQIRLFPKQVVAFDILADANTREVLYGGAAGSAKSYLGCLWQWYRRLQYAGTRGLMARARLKNLKLTTLNTLWVVAKQLGLSNKQHYHYDPTLGLIKLYNGSEILLRDLAFQPSDSDFTRLGSLELTDAFIDEANEVSERAAEVVLSRLRYKIADTGACPKLLMTCNPSRGWLYQRFYWPATQGVLPAHRAFIQAKLADHGDPKFREAYLAQLQQLPADLQQRLLLGDWGYQDETLALFPQINLDRALKQPNLNQAARWYITADIARFGEDSTAVGLWQDLHLQQVWLWQGLSVVESAKRIKELALKHQVSPNQVVIDADGIGGGVLDQLPGAIAFQANATPIRVRGMKTAFQHIKAQCTYALAEAIGQGQLSFEPTLAQTYHDGQTLWNRLCQELACIKRYQPDAEVQLRVTPKSHIKAALGRSPDLADMVMMRMKLALQPSSLSYF